MDVLHANSNIATPNTPFHNLLQPPCEHHQTPRYVCFGNHICLAYNFVNRVDLVDCLNNKKNAHFNACIGTTKDQNEIKDACIGTKTNIFEV